MISSVKHPIVDLHRVSFAYNHTPVLRAVDLQIQEGDLVCIVGPNGGGKTTLLRLILGLLKPDSGSVKVFGKPPRKACRELSYVPQQASFDPKFPVSVMDVVLMGCAGNHLLGPFRRTDREQAHLALERVGLLDLETRPFADLSGGQRQRVLIARALASQPRLLLLDEPTSNVDSVAEQQLYELLRQLNEDLTVVLVSHDLVVVSKLVSTVVCVNTTAHVHPTSELTGDLISNMYGGNVALVRHDQHDACCAEEGTEDDSVLP